MAHAYAQEFYSPDPTKAYRLMSREYQTRFSFTEFKNTQIMVLSITGQVQTFTQPQVYITFQGLSFPYVRLIFEAEFERGKALYTFYYVKEGSVWRVAKTEVTPLKGSPMMQTFAKMMQTRLAEFTSGKK